LIVGGVLVGRDLIRAAQIRAQISQIEQFNLAANNFKMKYGYLPGDIPNATALGLDRSGSACGHYYISCGNGDGVINSIGNWSAYQTGEPHTFWLDLSTFNMIPFKLSQSYTATTRTDVYNLLPTSKLDDGLYVYVREGVTTNDCNYGTVYYKTNYFSISHFNSLTDGWIIPSAPTVKVIDAYNIDTKIDDGLPTSGRVNVSYMGHYGGGCSGIYWPGRTTVWPFHDFGNPSNAAWGGSSSTCYDNKGVNGATQQYSIGQNGGEGKNCGLSFKFQ